MKRLALLFSILLLPAFAFAQTAPTFEIEELTFTSGIEKRAPVDEKTTFATGDRAWMWMKLKQNDDSATISFKWSWDGKDVWTSDPKAVTTGRTWFYKTVDQPGEWKVQILDNNNTVVKEATITVSGEPVYKKAAADSAKPAEPAAATGAKPATTLAESEDFGVVELKLATEIKDRNPVAPSTTFSAGDKIYSWVKLHVKVDQTQVKMRWYHNDSAVYTSDPVTVKKAPGWRTWLFKTVKSPGNWKVEVLDKNDQAVHAESFTVNRREPPSIDERATASTGPAQNTRPPGHRLLSYARHG